MLDECEHGSLRRKCPICERDEEIAELKADLEREQEAHYHAVGRANGFEFRAREKVAMRKEVEEVLGVESGPAGDEQFQKGLNALRELKAERNQYKRLSEKLKHLAKLGYHLSTYAASIRWDGRRNLKSWMDGLHEEIMAVQQEYRDVFGED